QGVLRAGLETAPDLLAVDRPAHHRALGQVNGSGAGLLTELRGGNSYFAVFDDAARRTGHEAELLRVRERERLAVECLVGLLADGHGDVDVAAPGRHDHLGCGADDVLTITALAALHGRVHVPALLVVEHDGVPVVGEHAARRVIDIDRLG